MPGERAATDVPTASSRTSTRDSFPALRYPQYRVVWFGGLIAFFAVAGQSLARAWLARKLTGTNAGLGGVNLGFGVSMLIATPWGGVVADRLSKRTVLMCSMALLTINSALIGAAVAFDFLHYWMLIAASALQALAFSFYAPARMAFIAELVDRPALSNAIVLGQMSSEGMRVIGPALAGVLIGTAQFGAAGVFLAGAALCLLATFSTLWLPPGYPAASAGRRSPRYEMLDGLRYLRADPRLRRLAWSSLGVVIIGFPYQAFLASIAVELFDVGAGSYGLLSAVTAIGAVIAGFFTARHAARIDPWRVLVGAGFGFGVAVALLGIAPNFGLELLVLGFVGATGLAFQTTNQSLMLSLSDATYHGRLQSVVMLGFGGFGIVALPLGMLADAAGLRETLVVMGAGVVLTMLVFMLTRPQQSRLGARRG